MTDILEEVLNDQNEAKRLSYFKKALPVIVILTILTICVMVISNWNKDNKVKNNQKNGDILIQSISMIGSDKNLALESLLNLINTNNNKAAELASLQVVSINIEDKKYSEAKVLLEKIIQNNSYQDITIAYARIAWISLVLNQDKLEDNEKEKLDKYLSYFDNEKKIFFGTANILKAIWYIKNSEQQKAKDILTYLLSVKEVLPIIKEQAKALISTIEQ